MPVLSFRILDYEQQYTYRPYMQTTLSLQLASPFKWAFHHMLETCLDIQYVINAIAFTVNTTRDGCRLCFQYTPYPQNGVTHTVLHYNNFLIPYVFEYVLSVAISAIAAHFHDLVSRLQMQGLKGFLESVPRIFARKNPPPQPPLKPYLDTDDRIPSVTTPNTPPPRPPLQPYPTGQPQADLEKA